MTRASHPVGRPRKRKTPIRRSALRAQSGRIPAATLAKFATVRDDIEWRPDAVVRTEIPPEIVREIEREGISLQWNTRTVRGQEQTSIMNANQRNGWESVRLGDFPTLDGFFLDTPDGKEIEVEGLVLQARPLAISEKSRVHQRREALMPLQTAKQGIKDGSYVPVPGGDHASARSYNHIRAEREPTFAAIGIPPDERG